MPRPLLLANCRRYDAPPGAPAVDVLVRDGRIARLGPPAEAAGDVHRVDAGGRLVAPGLIDIHVHGAGGADTSDGTPDALRTMSRALAAQGTTGFVATVVMQPSHGGRALREAAAATGAALGGARLLGVHVEGPFLNPVRRGGLPPDGIYPPSRAALDELLALAGDALRMVTVAPEVDGALPVIERLAGAGVVAAFGHSDATYEQTRAGIDAGIRHVTHLFNAMPALHHRAPGPLVAIAEREAVTAELICDGVHLDPRVVAFAARVLGLGRCVCITDGMRAIGTPDGPFRYNGRDAESRDGTARYADGTLIGTSVGIAEMARRFRRFTGCTLRQAIDAASRAPARVLGLTDGAGSLDAGAVADLVLLDDDLAPWATVVGGEVVWRR